MFETLFRQKAALQRHRTGPLTAERDRYLQHCAEQGATHGEQRKRAKCLLWIATRMSPADRRGVNAARLHTIVYRRPRPGPTMAQVFLEFGRPWLKFLGWWRVESEQVPFPEQLERYVTWMRNERGLSPTTIYVRSRRIARFLRWCGKTGRDFSMLRPDDLDAYFADFAAQWSRVSVATMATGLRVFLRYAASIGACRRGLSQSILSPRQYDLESLPYAPSWQEVRRLIASAASASPRDVRDRAILMLLAIYGLRRGEVAALRLDQIDWARRRLCIHRLKRRQSQVYPLQRSVAEALANYIDTVRPPVPCPEVFIRLQAPRQPISAAAIYHVVSERLRALGIEAAHLGPHALRHACATRLLASDLTLKEIGDHLGHRSTAATMIYTKVDLSALREVGAFDLGDLP
jgi:site-specific recombinase XerD